MKCSRCKQEFNQADIVKDGWGDWEEDFTGFVCRGCKQDLEVEFEAFLSEISLGSRQQAKMQVLCWRYLLAQGWSAEPPTTHDKGKQKLLQQVDEEIIEEKERMDCPWIIFLTDKMILRPQKGRTRAVIEKLIAMAETNEDNGPNLADFEKEGFEIAERPTLIAAARLLQELLNFSDNLS